MVTFSDYSEYLAKGDNLAKEDAAWLSDHQDERREVSLLVEAVLSKYHLDSVIEFGCGTGWLGNLIDADYLGVDANAGCLEIAEERRKNARAKYKQGNIRYCTEDPRELVVSFSFLKHFGLFEWADVFYKFLSFGKYAVFTLQLTDGEDIEDGTEYHHVWIGPDTLNEALKGHEILFTDLRWQDPHSTKRDVLFAVKRKGK